MRKCLLAVKARLHFYSWSLLSSGLGFEPLTVSVEALLQDLLDRVLRGLQGVLLPGLAVVRPQDDDLALLAAEGREVGNLDDDGPGSQPTCQLLTVSLGASIRISLSLSLCLSLSHTSRDAHINVINIAAD